jgi:hypothetical protein
LLGDIKKEENYDYYSSIIRYRKEEGKPFLRQVITTLWQNIIIKLVTKRYERTTTKISSGNVIVK